jgi:periplasmic divalent cation tolerance protein
MSVPGVPRGERSGSGGADVRVVLMTAPDMATAERIVRTLVEEGVAACGTLIPGVLSIYRWLGVVEQQEEVQVLLKAGVEQIDALLARAVELHPYDVPELLVLPVLDGFPPYLSWVRGDG